MQLQLSTWCEVEDYLTRSTGIIVPIGSTEQHGPNGLIGTDAICPETIARRVGDETGAMVAPTFNVGVAQHHMGFPGTITLRPSTMIASLRDWVESLGHHGFQRFYFLNGHGGNIATIQAAFAEIYGARSEAPAGAANRPSVRCTLRNWWTLPGVRHLTQELFGAKEGSHATPSEVSVTYFAHPDAVKQVSFGPPAPSGPILDAEDFRRRHPDGRMGSDPSVATPEHGGRLVDAASREVAEDYNRFLRDAA